MNLDELQSVQARERQSSDLQHLRSSFYREVGEYIQQLTDERDELVEDAEDPFSSEDVRRLTDDIETAEQTIEAIYERRVGKVVKKASIAAAGMPVGDEGLTSEEAALFDDLVARIEENRETVLSVLDGETSGDRHPLPDDGERHRSVPGVDDESGFDDRGETTASADSAVDTDADTGDDPDDGSTDDAVNAADLMGSDDDRSETDGTTTEVPPEPAPPGGTPGQEDDADAPGEASPGESGESTDPTDEGGEEDENEPVDTNGNVDGVRDENEPVDTNGGENESEVPGIPRTTVRITADVGEVVGADNRDYDLSAEDVVTLPEPNAEVLLDNDAAERLE